MTKAAFTPSPALTLTPTTLTAGQLTLPISISIQTLGFKVSTAIGRANEDSGVGKGENLSAIPQRKGNDR